MRKEFETSYHLLILSVATILAVLLAVVNLISDWETWIYPLLAVSVLFLWMLHFLRFASGRARLYIYVAAILFFLCYYGYHHQAIIDIPIILCLLVVILSVQKDLFLIEVSSLTYVLLLFVNLFITRFLWTVDQLVITRIVLGMVCLVCAVIASNFFIRKDGENQEQVEELREELAAVKGESESFLSNVSHELRTPINAVNGMSEILLARGLPREMSKEVRTIWEAGRRLQRQVSDMIDFSEIRTGHFYIQNENYEPVSVIGDAVTAIFGEAGKGNAAATGRGKDFAIDVEVALPKILCGDAAKLRKILICILDNAVKYTKEGGGYLYVSKREEEYGINLNIDLWDTGCGMKDEEVRSLFRGRVYQKSKGLEHRLGGMGLGSSIVQGIVTAMDGFCRVESEVGKGTHVHISIPQQVKNVEPCIHMDRASQYRIVIYINTDKYDNPKLGEYYYSMIRHFQVSLRLSLFETHSLEELKRAVRRDRYTHVLVSRWEYEMDTDYFQSIARETNVVVFTDRSFPLPQHCRIKQMLKPIYIVDVADYLRKTMEGEQVRKTLSKDVVKDHYIALVVDDDPMNLEVAGGILKTLGVSVQTAASGEEALKDCQARDYDIIFMDYMMPGLNGMDAMRRIRRIRDGFYREIPIIALTANAVSNARSEFLQAGFDEFLPKPIELPMLQKLLENLLFRKDRC